MLNFCFVGVQFGLNTEISTFITQEQVTNLSTVCSDSADWGNDARVCIGWRVSRRAALTRKHLDGPVLHEHHDWIGDHFGHPTGFAVGGRLPEHRL